MVLFLAVFAAVILAAIGVGMLIGRSAGLVCAVAGVVLAGATLVEARLSDRWSESNVSAQEFAQRFARVPKSIDDWHGEDLPVDEKVQEKSGAVGYVSRSYRNSRTGETVTLWLIVGHARDICRHTPDICYPSAGFHMQSDHNVRQTLTGEGLDDKEEFWTNTFIKEDSLGTSRVRVFWAWNSASKETAGKLDWEAPDHPRFYYGNDRALYKMYFSNTMGSATETADDSPAVRFAKRFLPVLNQALLTDPEATAPSETAPADAAPSQEAA
jgi:hypothetical protein